MAWTAQDLADIEAQIKKARRVRHGDKEVENYDLDKLLKLRDQMIQELNSVPRVYRARPFRGDR